MIRVFIYIVLILNVLACGPVKKASSNKSELIPGSFKCLSSQSTCEVSSSYGVFKIQFSAQPEEDKIKTELPFLIKLTFESINEIHQINNVSSYLEGKSMYMGKIPVFFERTGSNVYVAESLLASCTEEVMTWRLWLDMEIMTGKKINQQGFFIDFDSERL